MCFVRHLAANKISNYCSCLFLLQLTFPKAKLLLMSSNQEDLNDWYQSLSSAIRCVPDINGVSMNQSLI